MFKNINLNIAITYNLDHKKCKEEHTGRCTAAGLSQIKQSSGRMKWIQCDSFYSVYQCINSAVRSQSDRRLRKTLLGMQI
jgi:hypothetical protein